MFPYQPSCLFVFSISISLFHSFITKWFSVRSPLCIVFWGLYLFENRPCLFRLVTAYLSFCFFFFLFFAGLFTVTVFSKHHLSLLTASSLRPKWAHSLQLLHPIRRGEFPPPPPHTDQPPHLFTLTMRNTVDWFKGLSSRLWCEQMWPLNTFLARKNKWDTFMAVSFILCHCVNEEETRF